MESRQDEWASSGGLTICDPTDIVFPADGNHAEVDGVQGAVLGSGQNSASEAVNGGAPLQAAEGARGGASSLGTPDRAKARSRGAGVGLVGPLLARLRAGDSNSEPAAAASEME